MTERRSDVGLVGAFAARVRTRNEAGRTTESTIAEEVGVSAVRLRVIGAAVAPGQRVFAVIELSESGGIEGPRVAIRGRVLRVDPRPDASSTVVVRSTRHRWLFASGVGGRDAEKPEQFGP